MKPQDYTGRIHKDAFIISTATLLALVLVAVATRFIIRFRVQRQKFAVDDGLVLIALSCLLVGLVITYHEVMDRMYFIIGLQNNIPGIVMGPDWLMKSHLFHKWVTVSNMAAWCAVMAVKFSFMFFFRKLIDRMSRLNTYWWVLMAYHAICLGYGIATYYVGCPFYFDLRELQCAVGPYEHLLIRTAVAQMVLDIVGDLMILVMPTCILWRIRVQWSQKVALAFSLCLTAFMIATTIARFVGLIYHGMVDAIWEAYWTQVCGEVAVFIGSATTFRSFFVTRSNNKKYQQEQGVKYFFGRSFRAKFKRNNEKDFGISTSDTEASSGLPRIPRAQITGLRTFIDEHGKPTVTQN